MHPTVKPVAMIADAIKDVWKRNDVVLDCFGGSGSTVIAAHKTGRRAFVIELDPLIATASSGAGSAMPRTMPSLSQPMLRSLWHRWLSARSPHRVADERRRRG